MKGIVKISGLVHIVRSEDAKPQYICNAEDTTANLALDPAARNAPTT